LWTESHTSSSCQLRRPRAIVSSPLVLLYDVLAFYPSGYLHVLLLLGSLFSSFLAIESIGRAHRVPQPCFRAACFVGFWLRRFRFFLLRLHPDIFPLCFCLRGDSPCSNPPSVDLSFSCFVELCLGSAPLSYLLVQYHAPLREIFFPLSLASTGEDLSARDSFCPLGAFFNNSNHLRGSFRICEGRSPIGFSVF